MDVSVNKRTGRGLLVLGGSAILVITAIVIANRIRAKKIYNALNTIADSDLNSAANQQKNTTQQNQQYLVAKGVVDPAYFKSQGAGEYAGVLLNKAGQSLLLRTTANAIAAKIHDAHNMILPDTPTDVVTEFSLMKSKTVVSYICFVFQQNYGINLSDFLNDHFSSIEPTIIQTVASLPA